MPPTPLAVATTIVALVVCPLVQAHDAAVEMQHAANALLATLSSEQRTQATFPFADAERRNWHYVPRERRGLPIKQMTQEQRLLAHALLASGLSARGYTKAVGIMSLDSVLAVLENNPVRRDPENYYLTIFGAPGADAPWGWRFEGHHIALNFTFAADGTPVTTPQFFGANPAKVRNEPRAGFRALAAEEDLGRALVSSLSATQREQAVILAQAPREIYNEPGRQTTRPEGIAWKDLDAAQRDTLLRLVREYVGRFRPDIAEERIKRLEAAGLEQLHFAWAGPIEAGAPHYYRVQGGNFVLEYDNVQNGANHVHSCWRDFDSEFGADLLATHYKSEHETTGAPHVTAVP